ncbi:TolC family protein [Flavobacterium sp. '19STA2R22 D10 B1']|uniref:TolC family protein n=1 Tax=Flavobacterium aerium TaxID=3037261 RepID=UPI00278BC007|nr:TolC family protein [Flavobacterium sp. '19STA2R22 D10 B1']
MKTRVVLISIGFLCSIPNVISQNIWSLKECITYGRAHSFDAEEIAVLNTTYKEDKKAIHASYMPQYKATLNPSYTADYNYKSLLQTSLGLEINTIISAGSKKKYELQKADLIITQSEYAIATAQNNVEEQILYAYTNVLLAKEQYAILLDFYNRLLLLLDTPTLNENDNVSLRDDVFFNALLEQDGQELLSLKQQYEIALVRLQQTMNLPFDPLFEVDEIPEFMVSYPTLEDAFPKATIADPSISSRLFDQMIAQKDIAIAKSNLYPAIDFQYTPYHTWNSLPNQPDIQHYFGIRIAIPILNLKSQKANIQRATINLHLQETILDNQKEKLYNTVNLILQNLKNRQALFIQSAQSYNKTEELFSDTEERFLLQAVSYEDYMATRSWDKENALKLIALKYEVITLAKLLDFYTGVTL